MVFEDFRTNHATTIRSAQKRVNTVVGLAPFGGAGTSSFRATRDYRNKRRLRRIFRTYYPDTGEEEYAGQEINDVPSACIYAIKKTGRARNYKAANAAVSGGTGAVALTEGAAAGQILIPIPGLGAVVGVAVVSLVGYLTVRSARATKNILKGKFLELGVHRDAAAREIWDGVLLNDTSVECKCATDFAKIIMGKHCFAHAENQAAARNPDLGKDLLEDALHSW